jgi:predicted O-methyltransferase YrrM
MAPKNGKLVTPETFPKHMKPLHAPCDECGIHSETIQLINGQDKQRLCTVCLEDSIYDMVLNNSTLSVANTDDALVLL